MKKEPDFENEPLPEDATDEPLGHGDHWSALGLEGEAIVDFMRMILDTGKDIWRFAPPWPEGPFENLVQVEWPQAALSFACILGTIASEKSLKVVSSFPILRETADWVVRVDETMDSYGLCEGVVEGQVAGGHGLEWFAPYFGRETEHWRMGGLMRVGFAGLALRISPFAAESFQITEGPTLELRREELRAEGRHAEADAEDLSVTVQMDSLRTIFSDFHDHHQFVGRILAVEEVRADPAFRGWRMDLECLPEDMSVGHRLPLYVFSPALGAGYVPQAGDLVEGNLWLQGTWLGEADATAAEAWKAAGGADVTPQ